MMNGWKAICGRQGGIGREEAGGLGRWLENLAQDLRFGARQLRRNPGFTSVAAITLAIGVGATASVYGLIQGVLLSPPLYSKPERIVLVSSQLKNGQPYTSDCTVREWMDWQQATNSLERLALYGWTFNYLILPEGSQSLEGMWVTKDYFRVLGVHPILGRELTDDDAGRGGAGPKSIILGYDLWQQKFQGSRDILGKMVRISRMTPLEVVGVMPPGVRFLPDPSNASEPNYDMNARTQYWLPMVMDETKPKNGAGQVVGRLREGATQIQAQAEIRTLSARRAAMDKDFEGLTAGVRMLADDLNKEGRRLLFPLLAAVGLLFLVACGNLAGLLLARGLQRQQEYAVRSAIGAGKWRIFRQVLTESVAFAVVGALLGAVLAGGIIRIFKAVGGRALPRLDDVAVGWPVVGFGLTAAVVAAGVAALIPAVRAAGLEPFGAFKGSRGSPGRAERGLLRGVAVLQTGLSLALLVAGALLIRSVHNLGQVRSGYETGNILAMAVTSVSPEKGNEFHTRALERVGGLPGVKNAAFVWGLPLTGNKWEGDMEIVGEAVSSKLRDKMHLPLRSVTQDYFNAMGIRLASGRFFRPSDKGDAPAVAVINESLAARHFPGADPVGRKLRFAGDTNRTYEVVGIVADTRTEALNKSAAPEIYFSFWQFGAFTKHLIVRTASSPRNLIPEIRRELHDVDATAAVERFTTMDEIWHESVAPQTFAMRLLVGSAAVAAGLALVGIYGVLSLSVGSRSKELAVRVAIGAQRFEICRLILGEGFRLILVGLVLGTIASIAFGRILETFLFGVKPADIPTLILANVSLGVVALLACWLPARRAANTDPVVALRSE